MLQIHVLHIKINILHVTSLILGILNSKSYPENNSCTNNHYNHIQRYPVLTGNAKLATVNPTIPGTTARKGVEYM